MKDKDKITWIIKYCKNNRIDRILDKKYTGKNENWLKRNSSEIQAICAVFSVIIIGFSSIFLACKANNIATKQLSISLLENKPIISFSIVNNEDDTATIEIFSEGVSPKSFSVDVVNYFTFENQETSERGKPIIVHTITSLKQKKIEKGDNGKIAETIAFSDNHQFVRDYSNNITALAQQSSGSYCYWETKYNYLIKVTCIDIYNSVNEFYYIYDGYSGNVVSSKDGEKIFSERLSDVEEWKKWKNSMANGLSTELFRFETLDDKGLFYHAVMQMRKEGLWAYDRDGKKITYGEYDPE